MITKLKLFLILAFIAIGQSISYSQVVDTPYILPTNNLTVVNFIYTGADQQWTVPAGVTEIFVDVVGAQGGTRGSVLGGASGNASFSTAGGGGLIGGSISGDYGGSLIGGKGATQSAGGAAGTTNDPNSTAPIAGSALNGGNGGIVNPGAGVGNAQAGGGGGSSFINLSYVTVGSINMANQNNKGNGVINIYY